MKTRIYSSVQDRENPNDLKESVPEIQLTPFLKWGCVLNNLLIISIHFFAYQNVFKAFMETYWEVLVFSLLYAAGIGLLSRQCSNLFIHLRLMNIQTFKILRAHSIKVSDAFEWMKPSSEGICSGEIRMLTLGEFRFSIKSNVLPSNSKIP